jgi:hypothetical protein
LFLSALGTLIAALEARGIDDAPQAERNTPMAPMQNAERITLARASLLVLRIILIKLPPVSAFAESRRYSSGASA